MPTLKTRNLFISHAWEYDDHYWKLVNWFDDEPNFDWKNYSVPSHDSCSDTTKSGLKTCLTNQMRPAQGIIILAGMYAAHSGWIDYEIDDSKNQCSFQGDIFVEFDSKKLIYHLLQCNN